MTTATAKAIHWSEQGRVPDTFIRAGIRRLLRERLQELAPGNVERQLQMEQAFVREMNRSPVALVPEKANEQHYEVPARFFELVLGENRKYSCAYWPEGISNLDRAESWHCKQPANAPGSRTEWTFSSSDAAGDH